MSDLHAELDRIQAKAAEAIADQDAQAQTQLVKYTMPRLVAMVRELEQQRNRYLEHAYPRDEMGRQTLRQREHEQRGNARLLAILRGEA